MFSVERFADEVRSEVRHYRKRHHDAGRKSLLAGKSRAEQLAVVIGHIRVRSLRSPREWYR